VRKSKGSRWTEGEDWAGEREGAKACRGKEGHESSIQEDKKVIENRGCPRERRQA